MKLVTPLLKIRILGKILLIEAISFLLCIIIAYIYHEAVSPFIWSSLITGFASMLLSVPGAKTKDAIITNRDTFLIVSIAWVLFSIFGTLPYILSGAIPGFVDALFESTSGLTTTGASILRDVENLPHSVLFWRSLTHWIGGLGIIVLVILILPSLKVTGYQLFSLESSMKEKIHPKISGVVFRMLLIYIGLTSGEVILLVIGDMNLFDSICHSFGTVATGGFSTRNASLMDYSNYSQIIVMIFMFLAGTSQVVYYYLVKRNFRKVKHNEEFWQYLTIVLIAGTLASCVLLIHTSKPVAESFREGFFQVISVITCTGFANADYILWPAAGIMLIFLLMFSGGCTGSTSGGIKMARHLVVLKNIKRFFIRLSHPGAIITLKLNGKSMEEKTNISILGFIMLYFFIFLAGTSVLSILGSDPVTSASSVATCMAGIGPGLGTVGPMSNFFAMPTLSKILLSFLMILGRLEIIPVIVLMGKSFWRV